ncbi:methyl farnesoate epoxidase isoform X1 [Nomia melanderi]|uniref:methyl farnesoate epoxidase isoform X1 n=2 Tax=Nomia melanderi TaxID=2448451 RepID=UPI003FCE593D
MRSQDNTVWQFLKFRPNVGVTYKVCSESIRIFIATTMWFAVLSVVIVLILKVLLDYGRSRKSPPGPRGLPIIGNFLDVARLVRKEKLFSDIWNRLAEKYGPVCSIKLGMQEPTIIVSGKDAITEMLNRPEFDGRPNGPTFKIRCGGTPQGLLFTDSGIWHSQRRFTIRTLRQLGFGKYSMDYILQQDVCTLINIIIEMTKDGSPINIYSFICLAVFSHVWFLLEGTKFDIGSETPQLKEAISIFKDILRNVNVCGGIVNHFPVLRYFFPRLTGLKLFEERQKRIDDFFLEVVSKHKTDKVSGESTNFVDSYLEEIEVQNKKSLFSSFNESQLQYVLKDLFVASVDTTDNMIGFVIAYLVVHRDVQLKIQDEIDKTIGRSVCPSLSDKNRLPYLNAALTEVSRLANVAPNSLPHRALSDSNLLGFEIKRNYTLIANFKSVHLDKEHWGDPEVFRPERFINKEGEFVDDPWVMAFGIGRRKCLGETMARNTVFLFIACLLQKLHFTLPEKHPKPELHGIDGFLTSPPKMEIIVTQRQ